MHKEFLEQLKLEIEAGHEIEATDLLVFRLDDLFRRGDFGSAQELLQSLDLEALPTKVLGGAYMVCRHAQKELGDEFLRLAETVSRAVPGLLRRITQAARERT